MRPLSLFFWHVHGSWTTSFVQGPHRYLVATLPDRGPDGLGRAQTWCWPDSVKEVGPAEAAPQWDAVKALFEAGVLGPAERRMAMSSRAAGGLAETGPVICACFGVGLTVIRDAIASSSATNVEAIGKALRAGTNCGSCLPELKRIVHEHAHAV